MDDYLTKGRFSVPMDKARVAADWRGRGYSCHDFHDPPGREWRDFVHECQELVTVVAGRLELEVDGATVLAGPGDEVFIPRRAVHTVRNVYDGGSHWLFGYD